MAFSGIKKRAAARKEARAGRKALGGSFTKQEEIIGNASNDQRIDRSERAGASKELKAATKESQQTAREARGDLQYQEGAQRLQLNDQRNSIAGIGEGANQASGILGNALATGDLRGQSEGILAQRAQAMNAAPSYTDLANQAIQAQDANTRAQTQFAQGNLARSAMGMAAGSGEGGALNAQQAMTSLVGGGADMAMQNQLAQAQNAAAMRNQATMAQRGETANEAAFGSQARLGAAGQERANQMGVAGQQATNAYNSGIATNAAQAALSGAGQALTNTTAGTNQAAQTNATNLVGTQGQQALGAQDISTGAQTGLLTAGVNAAAGNEERSMARKIFTPFGMMGN